MKHFKLISILTVAVLALCGCTGYDTLPKGESKGIESSASLKALIDSGATVGDGEYRLVDVRPARKYAKGHIPTAINIPNGDVAKAKADLPKDKKIILYCETGGRAQAAAKNKLAPAGYSQIYNWGGFGKWEGEQEK
ncbi:MAG: rhodanese-like domain-containing protein [Deltaproteobacteria bacterium]|nr:rhodanese-like domain-containing protein [Deltaproteobacteria bacterium]